MTAHELLTTLQAHGVQLSRERDRLVIDAPTGTLTPVDRRSLEAHKKNLLAALGFGPDLAVLVLWFQHARTLGWLPDEPFTLAAWQQVVNPEQFYAALELDITIGPRGPRARFGGLANSLRRLRAYVEAHCRIQDDLPHG
jgi:hypothetical protein